MTPKNGISNAKIHAQRWALERPAIGRKQTCCGVCFRPKADLRDEVSQSQIVVRLAPPYQSPGVSD